METTIAEMEFPESIPITGTEDLVRSPSIFRKYSMLTESFWCPEGDNGHREPGSNYRHRSRGAKHGDKGRKELERRNDIGEAFKRSAPAGPTMYLCLLLHLFTTDVGVNLCWRTRNLPLTNLQRPKEVQEHFVHMISPCHGVRTCLKFDLRARPAIPYGFRVLKMLSNTKAITESWMIHRKAAEIKELEIPRRYIEDSTASNTTNERAKATFDQVRSGCSPPGVLSMQKGSCAGQRTRESWLVELGVSRSESAYSVGS